MTHALWVIVWSDVLDEMTGGMKCTWDEVYLGGSAIRDEVCLSGRPIGLSQTASPIHGLADLATKSLNSRFSFLITRWRRRTKIYWASFSAWSIWSTYQVSLHEDVFVIDNETFGNNNHESLVYFDSFGWWAIKLCVMIGFSDSQIVSQIFSDSWSV